MFLLYMVEQDIITKQFQQFKLSMVMNSQFHTQMLQANLEA